MDAKQRDVVWCDLRRVRWARAGATLGVGFWKFCHDDQGAEVKETVRELRRYHGRRRAAPALMRGAHCAAGIWELTCGVHFRINEGLPRWPSAGRFHLTG